MDGTDFNDFKAELLKDQKVRHEYDALKPKYAFIQAIITRRNELSLSQRQLARLSGILQPAICRLESGDENITVETLFKITNALKLDIEFKPQPLAKA